MKTAYLTPGENLAHMARGGRHDPVTCECGEVVPRFKLELHRRTDGKHAAWKLDQIFKREWGDTAIVTDEERKLLDREGFAIRWRGASSGNGTHEPRVHEGLARLAKHAFELAAAQRLSPQRVLRILVPLDDPRFPRKKEPKPLLPDPTVAGRVSSKLTKARANLDRALKAMTLAERRVEKWKQKVRYYERREQKLGDGGGGSTT